MDRFFLLPCGLGRFPPPSAHLSQTHSCHGLIALVESAPVILRIPKRAHQAVALVLCMLAGFLVGAHGQEPESEGADAFAAAARSFQDGVYDRAAVELGTFVETHPRSERVPEAVLLRARALLASQRAEEAISWVTAQMSTAGAVADKYRYVLGEAYLRQTNYQAAAAAFQSLIQEYPKSPLILDASFQEAWARFGLGDLPAVVNLLQNPANPFQVAARERPEASSAVEGYLLLGLALLLQQQFAAAEQALAVLAPMELVPQLQWCRLYLLCQVQMQDQRLAAALAGTTNLLNLARFVAEPQLQAAALEMQGSVLTRLERFGEAMATYEDSSQVPAEYTRQALLRVIALGLEHRPAAELIASLERFLAQYPDDPAKAEALVALGELHLRQHTAQQDRGGQPAGTNQLQLALGRFQEVLSEQPESPWRGRAQLGRGWCYWLQDKIGEAETAFSVAASSLPWSEAQAVARFKLAETQLRSGSFTQSVSNLNSLITDYRTNGVVRKRLFPYAYYQLVRGSLELGELAAATVAMQTILRDYPESALRDPGLLLVGQSVSETGDRGLARNIYQGFINRFPDSPLVAEVGLALARSYGEGKDWKSATQEYAAWLDRFPTNALRPQAEFNLAWANAQAGLETNAVRLFAQFVERFPTDTLAARARYWVGDYFFSKKQYVEAQIHYQKLAETFAGTPLAYQARLMAGRAAFASRFWKDAAGTNGHFKVLVRDDQCPPDLRAQAYFALGDTFIEQGQVSTNDDRQPFEEAIVAFSKIPALYPTNRLVPLAWGRVGDCYLQLGMVDPNLYPKATNAYSKVLQSPQASPSARCQAELGIGRVLEQLAELHPASDRAALLAAARDRYLNVVYGKTNDGAPTDPFWLKEAGLAAARLAESAQQWEIASNLYARLVDLLPPLRTSLERRLQRAQDQMRQARN